MQELLNDFKILSITGCGAFGTCFKIYNEVTNKIFTLNSIDYDNNDTDNNNTEDVLLSEINVLKQLKHPNIVQYYDHYVNNETKTILIIMEYCGGGYLDQLIDKYRNNKLQFEEKYIWRVLYQISGALQVCHRNNIINGINSYLELKPANILIDKNGNIKLKNIGLASILKRRKDSFAKSFVGKLDYMSPEIIEGRKYDKKTDIWATGCLIYEMCSLEHIFNGTQFLESENVPVEILKSIPDSYSTDIQAMLTLLLELNRVKRPSIDIIIRHPILIRNLVNFNIELPLLLECNENSSPGENKLDYTPKTSFPSEHSSISGICSPELRKELFGSNTQAIFKRTRSETNLTHHYSLSSEVIKSEYQQTHEPAAFTQTIFNQELKDRLQKIRAYESLLNEKEITLLTRSNELDDREKRIAVTEQLLEQQCLFYKNDMQKTSEKHKEKFGNSYVNDLTEKLNNSNSCVFQEYQPFKRIEQIQLKRSISLDDTYCSVDPNDSIIIPTIAKLDLASLTSSSKITTRKTVKFESPRKFYKYIIDEIPERRVMLNNILHQQQNKLKLSKDVGKNVQTQKKKSIFSIFSYKSSKHKECKRINLEDKIKSNEHFHKEEISDKLESRNLTKLWTVDNKRAAFHLLATMNEEKQAQILKINHNNDFTFRKPCRRPHSMVQSNNVIKNNKIL